MHLSLSLNCPHAKQRISVTVHISNWLVNKCRSEALTHETRRCSLIIQKHYNVLVSDVCLWCCITFILMAGKHIQWSICIWSHWDANICDESAHNLSLMTFCGIRQHRLYMICTGQWKCWNNLRITASCVFIITPPGVSVRRLVHVAGRWASFARTETLSKAWAKLVSFIWPTLCACVCVNIELRFVQQPVESVSHGRRKPISVSEMDELVFEKRLYSYLLV